MQDENVDFPGEFDSQPGIHGDFSLQDEYKPDPLTPQGNYRGNVVGVTVEAERHCITWKVCLDGNGGVQSDGNTPIDGSHQFFRNWLPKPGDDNEMEANGRVTKRQGKINRLSTFAGAMGIAEDMDTPVKIMESIEEQKWIGIEVICSVTINEYQGNVNNQVNKMVKLPA